MDDYVQAAIGLIDFKKLCQRSAKSLGKNDAVDPCMPHDQDISPCRVQNLVESRSDSKAAIEKAFSLRGPVAHDIEAPCLELFRVLPADLLEGQAFPVGPAKSPANRALECMKSGGVWL